MICFVLGIRVPGGRGDVRSFLRLSRRFLFWLFLRDNALKGGEAVMVFVVVWKREKLSPHEGKKDGGGMGVWPGKRTWCHHRSVPTTPPEVLDSLSSADSRRVAKEARSRGLSPHRDPSLLSALKQGLYCPGLKCP